MEVTIYTRRTPRCDFCESAKDLLRAQDIAFTEVNISGPGFDINKLKTEIAPGATTVPVVIIDGVWIGGATELEALDLAELKKIKYPESKLRAILRANVAVVTFIKKDGSERQMTCTLNPRVIPVDKLPKTSEDAGTDTLHGKINTVVKVFDIHSNGWRSINLTTVIGVESIT